MIVLWAPYETRYQINLHEEKIITFSKCYVSVSCCARLPTRQFKKTTKIELDVSRPITFSPAVRKYQTWGHTSNPSSMLLDTLKTISSNEIEGLLGMAFQGTREHIVSNTKGTLRVSPIRSRTIAIASSSTPFLSFPLIKYSGS